ncbi:hypothetical protein TW65_90023 [Stemphylium lycopersici]|uniref:Uncharacterized protein n=1 Tax=Stemphylium lycopersici TaxID=183478 RepID=A0A364MRM6_STELY|nr:hypothetical protein TW65_90023 [Stemphylium lycopersici]RAR00732.1 hypothetical protein DDE83_009061 [Stemphylium lycopersici]
MHVFLPLVLTASAANAWRLSWYIGQSCQSQLLYSVSYPYGSGYNTDPDVANSKSILASQDSPEDNEYEVALYTTNDCSRLTAGILNEDSVCFPDTFGNVQSYRVQHIEGSRKSKPRSIVEISRDVDAWMAKRPTGLAVRSQERDLDLAPAKTHPNITALAALAANAAQADHFHTFVSVSTALVTHTLTLTSLVTRCLGVDGAGPIGSVSCATSLAGTAISFIATLYHSFKGYREYRATVRQGVVNFNGRNELRRRGIDDTLAMSQEDYMALMLHNAGLDGTHIGYHDRLDTNTTSPAFHFHGGDGQQFVWTISPLEDGEIHHTIAFHHDTKIEKRQGYEGVRVNGRLDIQACQRKNADWSDLPYSAPSAYEYYVKDLRCLLEASDLYNADYISSDVFDKSGNSAITIGMSTYRGDDSPKKVGKRKPCTNEDFGFSESCIF